MTATKKFTVYAAKAVSLADVFKGVFSGGLAGPVLYAVELTEPDGPSTAGGKLATQHVKLVPADGGSTIVVGSVHLADKSVELRTFAYLTSQHAQRFKGASLPVDKEAYAALVKRLQVFFTDEGMTVVMVDVSPQIEVPEPTPSQRASEGISMKVWGTVAVMVIAFGALATWFTHR